MLKKICGVIMILSLSLLINLPVNAIIYGGIGGRPAYPNADNAQTKDIFVYQLEPKAIKEDGILVINNSQEEQTVLVYAADYEPSTDGGYACKQLGQENIDIGSWIKFKQPQIATEITDVVENTNADNESDQVNIEDEDFTVADQPIEITLAAQKQILIPFVLTVPDQTDVGEHDGCILVQKKGTELIPGDDAAQKEGINLSIRTGVRVAVTIPGTIIKNLSLANFELLPRPQGGKIIKTSVRNDGNVSVDADVSVSVKDIFSREIQKFGGAYSILRDQTSVWNYEVAPSFWGNFYQADAVIDYNNSEELNGKTAWFFMNPSYEASLIYVTAVFIILVLIAIFIYYFLRRRWIKKTWQDYKVEKGEKLKLIAKKYKVSWRLLAKANKIEPPYDLKANNYIKVPSLRKKK